MRSVERCLIADIPESLRAQLDTHSFFGSTGFAAVWESLGGKAVCWILTDGDSIIAALTGVEFRRRPLTRFQAMPDGCYARIWAPHGDQDGRARYAKELVAAIWKSGYAGVHIADYFRELGLEAEAGSRAYETLVVDISPADWQPPDAKLQSEIRKAEREGVVVSTFSSQPHLDRFMDLMTQTERRHSRQPKYSREFFRRLAELATSDTRVKWLWVEQDGAPVVSHIYFVERTMALNWQIYYDKEFSSLKANQHAMFVTAKSLAASGVKLLNLGATPPEADSVRAYKEKWGGVVYTYPISTRRSWLGRLL